MCQGNVVVANFFKKKCHPHGNYIFIAHYKQLPINAKPKPLIGPFYKNILKYIIDLSMPHETLIKF